MPFAPDPDPDDDADGEPLPDWLEARLGSAAAMTTLAAIGGGLCKEARLHVPEPDPLFAVMIYTGLGMIERAEARPTRAAAAAGVAAFRYLMQRALDAGYPVTSDTGDDDPEASPKPSH